MDLGAIWRFLTDGCEGGRKATAVSIKICAIVLCTVAVSVVYVGPVLLDTYEKFSDTLDKVDRQLELMAVRANARDIAISTLRADTDANTRDVFALKSDLRHLDDTTVKKK